MNPSSENASWLCESWDNLGGGATSMSSVGLGLETARRLDWDWDGAAAVATTNSLFVSPQAQTQHHRRQGLEQQQQQQQPPSPEDQKPHILPTQSSSFRQYTALGLTGGYLNSGVRGLEGNVQLGAASSSFQPGGLLYEDLSGFGTGFPAEPSSRSQFQFHGGAGGNSGFHEVVKREEMYPVDFHAARIGLNLGHRTYFSAEDASVVNRIYRRPRAVAAASQVPRCQAEGCKADLTNAKHYHRRHKVCEYHSKATSVITGGVQQRFCQQCSRFHVLSEFDEVKRSCRKRLADHNRRRRKPHASSLAVSATASSSEATASLASNAENEDNAGVGPGCASTPPHGSQGSPSMRTESQSLLNAIPLPLMSTNPGIVTMNSPKVAVPGQQYVQANTNTVASSLKGASLSLSSPSMAMSPCKATAGSQSQNYNGLELALPWLSRSNSDYGGGASSNRQMDMLQLQQTPAILSDKTSAVESLNFLPLTSREWVLESTENQQHDQEDEHQIFSLMGASSSQQDNSVVVAQAQEHHQASSARPVEYISHLHRGGGMRSKGDTQAELHSKIADGYRTFGSTSIYDADL